MTFMRQGNSGIHSQKQEGKVTQMNKLKELWFFTLQSLEHRFKPLIPRLFFNTTHFYHRNSTTVFCGCWRCTKYPISHWVSSGRKIYERLLNMNPPFLVQETLEPQTSEGGERSGDLSLSWGCAAVSHGKQTSALCCSDPACVLQRANDWSQAEW